MSERKEGKVAGGGLGLLSAARALAVVGLPFVALIVYLALHRAGQVPRVKEIAYERTLILNLLLYWLLAAAIYGAWRHRTELKPKLHAVRAPLLLMAFSTLISFAFAEVALRILRPHAAAQPFERLASETLHHRNAPNRRSLGMGNQWVETNSDGFRTSYERQDFLELEHRVVLLGDSYTFGLGVAVEDGVAAVLERGLRDRLKAVGSDDDVGVLNTGVISYSPLLERQAFREVAKHYRPTLTLLLVDANDIGDDYQYSKENISSDPDSPRFDVPAMEESSPGLCDRSAICRLLGPLWDRLAKPKQVLGNLLGKHRETYDYYAFEAQVGEVKERNRFFILRHPLELTLPYFERSWGYIENIAADVSAEGSAFALVIMPRYFHWNDAECPDNWESDRYGVDEPFENAYLEFFDRQIEGADFPIWSLLGPFAEHSAASDERLVFEHDPHWNRAGHRVAGNALAHWLAEAGWPEAGLRSAGSRPSFPVDQAPAEGTADGGEG